jgi:hypothetical protein
MRFNFLKLDMLCRQLFWQWNTMRVLFLEQTLAPLQVTAQLESTLSMTQNPNLVQLQVDGIVHGSDFGILVLLKESLFQPISQKE